MTRRPVVLAAVLLGALVVLVGGTPGTWALFSDSASVTAGTTAGTAFTAGAVSTPKAPATAQTSTTAVTLTWAATAVGTAGGVASSYDVVRYASAGATTGTTVCAAVSALTCVDSAAPAGTSYYLLRARVGDSWLKDSVRVAYVPDTTAPTLTITTPLTACSGTTVACGTATDTGGGTVARVEYALRRTRQQVLTTTTYTCWNGSGYVAANADNSCPFSDATGTTSWTVPGARTGAYPAAPFLGSNTFLLTVRATDTFGNVSTRSATYSN